MSQTERKRELGRELQSQALILGGFILSFWLIELIDWLLPVVVLDAYGIVPRRLMGLRGIILAPFLHDGFGHVAANTVPFLVLGWLVILHHRRTFLTVTIITALVSGLGVWFVAPSRSVHIGASGLIFGFLGYLLLRGYFSRSCANVTTAVLVGLFYGGLIWGILPQGNGISWQGHLFGFVGGGLAAYLLAPPAGQTAVSSSSATAPPSRP